MELDYAPAISGRPAQSIALVIVGGLISGGLALAGLHYEQQQTKTDIMTFSMYLIPVGAIFVGLVSGLGYAIASYFSNVRVHGWLIICALTIQVTMYLTMGYVEFLAKGPLKNPNTGARLSYPIYFHLTTVNMRWIKTTPEPVAFGFSTVQPPPDDRVGFEGYLLRGLGISGFAIAGLIPLGFVASRPYCALCQRYMRVRQLLRYPASGKLAAVRASNRIDVNAPEHRAARQSCLDLLNRAREYAHAGDTGQLKELVGEKSGVSIRGTFLVGKLLLHSCDNCHQGKLAAELVGGPANPKAAKIALFRETLTTETVLSLRS